MDSTTNKMLIDATHPEETRVVVLKENRVEEFDYESANKQQLRGNIYLAKVTRVEPSLQAAFVDYGGNRHGFLAFNEIHPDYYQIPTADREALLEQEAEEAHLDAIEDSADEAPEDDDADDADDQFDADANDDEDDTAEGEEDAIAAASAGDESISEDVSDDFSDSEDEADLDQDDDDESDEDDDADRAVKASVDEVGNEDALEEVPRKRRRRARHYKIQEVIRRRQILLVQVVKEERGNKGAALTTYLSLAGRHTVLMPNTARGGGISRKITNVTDRKRLRTIANELDVQEGMGLIIRTAGASRTKAEIKRDYEYLLRLWETVRELTLQSIAPTLVYEEGDLIKRSIRDLYNKEIEEILVAGEDAHKDAKRFMKMLMPSHAKHVKHYKDAEPLFAKYHIERQLNAMFSPHVTLPSGGYIVINQTEALVAVDVNSGKSTREHSIEDTALKTNLEAATELSRQLRLRDLAGLIVIDFIDMDERRNNRSVERRLKDCLKNDRARIQVGRISPFGLLEMSRQRLRTGVLEGSTTECAHCQGTGVIRSTESVALGVLRALEDALQGGRKSNLAAKCSTEVALYILNSKRDHVTDMEERYGISLFITGDDQIHGANYVIEIPKGEDGTSGERVVAQMDWGSQQPADGVGVGDGSGRKKRRRRRRRSSDDSDSRDEARVQEAAEDTGQADEPVEAQDDGEGEAEEGTRERRRGRRRGRRGGRNNRSRQARRQDGDAVNDELAAADAQDDGEGDREGTNGADASEVIATEARDDEEKSSGGRRRRRRSPRSRSRAGTKVDQVEDADSFADTGPVEPVAARDATDLPDTTAQRDDTPKPTEPKPTEPQSAEIEAEEPSRSRRRWRTSRSAEETPNNDAAPSSDDMPTVEPAMSEDKPVKKGWWQRRIGG